MANQNAPKPNDQRSNTKNPNNPATKAAADNKSRQGQNPTDKAGNPANKAPKPQR